MILDNLLRRMIQEKASDLILKLGSPTCFRIDGELIKDTAILKIMIWMQSLMR